MFFLSNLNVLISECIISSTVIPSKDVDSLYNAMIQLRTDIKMNEKLSKNSREMISSRFDKEYVQGCLLGFYQNVLGK